MKIYHLLLFTALFFWACKNDKNPDGQAGGTDSVDSLAYESDFYEDKYCLIKKQDTLCAEGVMDLVKLTAGMSPESMAKANKALRLDAIANDTTTVEEMVDDFIHSVDEFKEESPDYWPNFYQMDTKQEVILNTKNLFTGHTLFYSYLGGAHGIYHTQNFNIDPTTGENLQWQGLFTDTLAVYDLAKKSLGEVIKERDPDSEETDPERYYNFDEGGFYLPANFSITDNHIEFMYTVYEIASYAEGEITATLSFEEILPLLKEDTALSRHVKTAEL